MKKSYLGSSASSICLLLATPCLAQNAAQSDIKSGSGPQAGIEDIVVTATRRSESSQRTAIPITAVNGDTLAAKGVIQPEDLNTSVAGLALSQNGSTTQIYLRGVGTFSGPAGDSSIAVSLDQIVLNSPSMLSGNFYDLERVEVLKGPQGTLYGRNATAGAINLITKKPRLGNTSFDGGIDVGNYNLFRTTGALNLPVADTIAIRAAGEIVRRGAYFTDGAGNDKSEAGRLQALWDPTASISLLLAADYVNVHGRGDPSVVVPFVDPKNPYVGPSTTLGNSKIQAAISGGVPPGFPPGTPFPIVANDSYVSSKSYGARAELNWNLGGATLTAVGGYRHVSAAQLIYPGFKLPSAVEEHEEVAEVRLSSPSGGALKWLMGGYYFADRSDVAFEPDQGIFVADYTVATTIRSYAAFGEVTYSLADSLRATGGLRYTKENRTQAGGAIIMVPPGSPITSFPGSASFSNVSYKAGLEYDAGPRSLIYLTVSSGFRSGGLNPDGPPNTYRPEKLTAFTLGSKNRFFSNKLQINFEGFYWKYSQHQENVLLPLNVGGFGVLIQNIGKSTLRGANVDVQFQPNAHDLFTAQVEYLDAKLDNYSFVSPLPQVALGARTTCIVTTPPSPSNPASLPFIAPAKVNCDGKPFTRAPKWSALVAFQHVFPLSNNGKIVVGVNTQISSSYYTATDFLPDERQGSYAFLGANAGYEAPDGRWSLTLYGRNITNRAVQSSSFEHPFIPGLIYATLKPPRTYGATLQFHF